MAAECKMCVALILPAVEELVVCFIVAIHFMLES